MTPAGAPPSGAIHGPVYFNHALAVSVTTATAGCEMRRSADIAQKCSRTSSVFPTIRTQYCLATSVAMAAGTMNILAPAWPKAFISALSSNSPTKRGWVRSSQAGRKVFTLQTLSASDEPFDDGVGKEAGFSLHARVAARADEREKLERLCRYISRPAVSEKRLSLTQNGNVRYQLQTP